MSRILTEVGAVTGSARISGVAAARTRCPSCARPARSLLTFVSGNVPTGYLRLKLSKNLVA
eukprot:4443741-Alexandrium_andersonii.AAC.1